MTDNTPVWMRTAASFITRTAKGGKVRVRIPGEKWELYTTEPNQSRKEYNAAVREINATLEKAINERCTDDEILSRMAPVMTRHASQGASDSEPYGLLEALAERFGWPGSKERI